MGRLIAFLAFIAFVAMVIWGIPWLYRYASRRRSQRLLAKISPESLHHFDNIPKGVVETLIEQGNQLDEAERILRALHNDEVVQMTLSSEHYKPIEKWLKSQMKEISK